VDALPPRAEVVVIGGGVVGTSVAFHLAEAGTTDVVVLEAGALGRGSSGKPIGGLRGQFSDEVNVALAARSLRAYAGLDAATGGALRFDRVGYLFLLRTDAQVRRLEASMALQHRLGVATRMLGVEQARALCPLVDPARFVAATLSPGDGHALPAQAVAAWAGAARRRGTRIVEHCPVTGIDVRGGEVAAVRTARGAVATSVVVCAAGAWSARIGAMAGVALEVRPVRRQIALTAPRPGGHPRVPFTIDLETSFYFHGAGDGLLLGFSDPAQAAGFDRDYDDGWLPELRALAGRCAPALAGLPVAGGWAGLYEQTPDANALIGEAPAVSRFLYATGFSGHGFSQAPAAGEVVRDLVRGDAPVVDVTPLRAERFAERAPILEATIV
jgi:sarcosine oxidase subunit beta